MLSLLFPFLVFSIINMSLYKWHMICFIVHAATGTAILLLTISDEIKAPLYTTYGDPDTRETGDWQIRVERRTRVCTQCITTIIIIVADYRISLGDILILGGIKPLNLCSIPSILPIVGRQGSQPD